MTRAKEELVLTWARDYGGRSARRMSQFVLEALDLPPATPVESLRPSVAERLARKPPPGRPAPPAPPPSAALPPGRAAPLPLSSGQASDYLECPAKYRYGHLIRIPTPVSHQMVYGRALHAAVEAYQRRQMTGQHQSPTELT